jgi:hypothetical protein
LLSRGNFLTPALSLSVDLGVVGFDSGMNGKTAP